METAAAATTTTTTTTTTLRAVFLPFPSTSHTIRVVDTARIFAMYGVDITIITTPSNAKIFQTSIDHDSARGYPIRTHLINFPHVPGLPQGVETFNSQTPQHIFPLVLKGLFLLEEPIKKLLRDHLNPDFIVFDMFCTWCADVAAALEIPGLVCLAGSFVGVSGHKSIEKYAPHTKVDSDDEPFLLPGLPHKLKMTRSQLPNPTGKHNPFIGLLKELEESVRKSYGSLFNSFFEIEGIYEEHYKATTGTKSWGVGPISLWVNQDASDKGVRGAAIEEREPEGWQSWLDSKAEDSVLYVVFGSWVKFNTAQIVEIAHALEDFGHDFIWVVGKFEEQIENEGENNFFKEFEKRVVGKNRGYLIRGWAPQLLILEHPAIGGVVTHCGWKTVLECVNEGLPMATMPIFAEQFYNEKLVVDVLGIGVSIGVKKFRDLNEVGDEVVKREKIMKAISFLMGDGEETLKMRRRAKELGDASKKAIQPGGSSDIKMKELIHEMKALKLQKLNH
jgi:soyasapogenol B glucuronide galactosyltransferase